MKKLNLKKLQLRLFPNIYTRALEIPFTSDREAEIAYEVLRVDKEPPRSQVSKSLISEKNILRVSFNAPTAHQLRTGVNGFLDALLLVCETMISFGPPVRTENN